MLHYYEIAHYDGEQFPVAQAFDTLEEAIEFADDYGYYLIVEIGGDWIEYEKCEICKEWLDSEDIHLGVCYRCEEINWR